jgi:hypothetical protein
MKPSLYRLSLTALIFFLLFACLPGERAAAQDATATPENTAASADRPLVVIQSYFLNQDTIRPGQSFILYLSVKNQGTLAAQNLIFGFSGEDFLPQETGGVVAVGSLGSGANKDIAQPLLATYALWGRTNGTVSVRLSYSSPNGESYSEAFIVTLDVLGWSGNSSTVTPTPTATSAPRAQLVVAGYSADVDPLQPGTIFNLNLEVHNLGSGDARSVTMILGGGSFGSTGGDSTPQPGGVSGGSAELSNFAPIGSSNLQFLGDVAPGAVLKTNQKLIVNVSANPGAYTFKLSFAYTDLKGNHIVDDQIITLLVFQIPQIEVNFYRDPGPISAMMPNTLPIQVVNLGRKSAVLGNMTITAENADLSNNVSLVGTLDAGGYFPLDVMFTPQTAGPTQIKVTINYTDDFNQARVIEKSISINVLEGMVITPGAEGPGIEPGTGDGGMPPTVTPVEETFWQKVLRFIKGLVGLDSAPAQPQGMPGDPSPSDGGKPVQPQPLPVVPGGKG